MTQPKLEVGKKYNLFSNSNKLVEADNPYIFLEDCGTYFMFKPSTGGVFFQRLQYANILIKEPIEKPMAAAAERYCRSVASAIDSDLYKSAINNIEEPMKADKVIFECENCKTIHCIPVPDKKEIPPDSPDELKKEVKLEVGKKYNIPGFNCNPYEVIYRYKDEFVLKNSEGLPSIVNYMNDLQGLTEHGELINVKGKVWISYHSNIEGDGSCLDELTGLYADSEMYKSKQEALESGFGNQVKHFEITLKELADDQG